MKGHTRTPAPMLNYPVPKKTWERIHLDTLELPLSENGFKYLLVIIEKEWGPARLQQLWWYYTAQCARQGACSPIADANSQPPAEAAET